jgi:hypothetical protein
MKARSPTSATSEAAVAQAKDSEPWKSGTSGKYQYHPGGDPSNPKKDAPSALNVTVIPNVTLPKVACLLEKCKGARANDKIRNYMTDSTSGMILSSRTTSHHNSCNDKGGAEILANHHCYNKDNLYKFHSYHRSRCRLNMQFMIADLATIVLKLIFSFGSHNTFLTEHCRYQCRALYDAPFP